MFHLQCGKVYSRVDNWVFIFYHGPDRVPRCRNGPEIVKGQLADTCLLQLYIHIFVSDCTRTKVCLHLGRLEICKIQL